MLAEQDNFERIVCCILDALTLGKWKRWQHSQKLADQLGCDITVIDKAEVVAWKRFCVWSNNPENVRPDLAGGLMQSFHTAVDTGKLNAAAKLADTLSKITGARAPEKLPHAAQVQQYEHMTREQKLEALREHKMKIEEAEKILMMGDGDDDGSDTT